MIIYEMVDRREEKPGSDLNTDIITRACSDWLKE